MSSRTYKEALASLWAHSLNQAENTTTMHLSRYVLFSYRPTLLYFATFYLHSFVVMQRCLSLSLLLFFSSYTPRAAALFEPQFPCRPLCYGTAYFSGKMLAKMGRIALIAEEMGRPDDARMVASRLAEASQARTCAVPCYVPRFWLGKLESSTEKGTHYNTISEGGPRHRCCHRSSYRARPFPFS